MFATPLPIPIPDPALGFASGTPIHTKEGQKPIEDIRVGDWVLTHLERVPPPRRRRQSSEYLFRRVMRTSSVDVQSLVRINVQNLADGLEDSLLVATDQPIWTQPLGWLAASQVCTGQALVLSFNGNAMVKDVQACHQPARVYRLEVDECSTYYVERLGIWVGCSPDTVVQAVTGVESKPAFDFSTPQVLLQIKDYYNDTLAQPESSKTLAPELAAQMREAAERMRSKFQAQIQQELDYDEAGVRWLDAYIDRARLRPSNDRWQGAIYLIGAFLGECVIRNLGGQWSRHEDMFCVVLTEGGVIFAHNKVAKQFQNGTEGGDSILGFYHASKSLHTGWAHKSDRDSSPPDILEQHQCKLVANTSLTTPASSSGAHFVKPMQPRPEMEYIINKLRTSYELRQQRMSAMALTSLTGPRPSWLQGSDGLTEFFKRQELLLTEGHIVWGALVQANSLLFKPGGDNCPALLVHSPDHYFDSRPQELRLIGSTFFSFKNTDPTHPELKAVARLVTDEMNRSMGFELPPVFSSKVVHAATFMVFRQHVPNGVLSFGVFPILTHPLTPAVMMVPFEFWPIELIVLWKENNI